MQSIIDRKQLLINLLNKSLFIVSENREFILKNINNFNNRQIKDVLSLLKLANKNQVFIFKKILEKVPNFLKTIKKKTVESAKEYLKIKEKESDENDKQQIKKLESMMNNLKWLDIKKKYIKKNFFLEKRLIFRADGPKPLSSLFEGTKLQSELKQKTENIDDLKKEKKENFGEEIKTIEETILDALNYKEEDEKKPIIEALKKIILNEVDNLQIDNAEQYFEFFKKVNDKILYLCFMDFGNSALTQNTLIRKENDIKNIVELVAGGKSKVMDAEYKLADAFFGESFVQDYAFENHNKINLVKRIQDILGINQTGKFDMPTAIELLDFYGKNNPQPAQSQDKSLFEKEKIREKKDRSQQEIINKFDELKNDPYYKNLIKKLENNNYDVELENDNDMFTVLLKNKNKPKESLSFPLQVNNFKELGIAFIDILQYGKQALKTIEEKINTDKNKTLFPKPKQFENFKDSGFEIKDEKIILNHKCKITEGSGEMGGVITKIKNQLSLPLHKDTKIYFKKNDKKPNSFTLGLSIKGRAHIFTIEKINDEQ